MLCAPQLAHSSTALSPTDPAVNQPTTTEAKAPQTKTTSKDQKDAELKANSESTPEEITPVVWDWSEAIDRIEKGNVYFKTKMGGASSPVSLKPIKTQYVLLEMISVLHPEEVEENKENQNLLPYYLFSALPCQNCENDKKLFLVRADGEHSTEIVYPGEVMNPKSNRIDLKARAFYGKCTTKAKGDILVFYNEERLKRRRYLQLSVFVATLKPDSIDEKLLISRRSLPSLSRTIKYVKQKKCKEILGIKRKLDDFKLKKTDS